MFSTQLDNRQRSNKESFGQSVCSIQNITPEQVILLRGAICSKFGKQDKNKIRCFRVKTTVLFMIIVPKTINLLTKVCKKQLEVM